VVTQRRGQVRTNDVRASTARNAALFATTVATVGVLFLYPTSSNRESTPHRPGQVAPAGIVAAPAPTASGGTGSTGSGTTTAPVVINGVAADTQYGPVQVQIQVSGGKIVSATAIDYPQSGGRDRQINSYAIPVLQSEAVAAQSAKIDSVSGATYTSDGYLRSLQSALDAAHLG
jgi:hypothetical protein